MADILIPQDVPVAIKATINDDTLLLLMIAALNSKVARVAPCLFPDPPAEPDQGNVAEAKLIMIATLKRWGDAGSGGIQTEQNTAGIFSHSTTIDTRQRSGWTLRPSEIADLQAICDTGDDGGAFTVDQVQLTGANPFDDRPDLLFQWVFPAPTHPASEL